VSAWDLLAAEWPLTRFSDDAARLNRELGLADSFALSVDMRPSFFVGRLGSKTRFLAVGMNPRRNTDSDKWQRVLDALNDSDFERYRGLAEGYFLDSQRFNAEHYRLVAKVLSRGGQLPEPAGDEAVRYFLNDFLVQSELMPFASEECALSAENIRHYHETYESGKCAARILESLFHDQQWEGLVVSGLGTPWDVVAEHLGAELHKWVSGIGGIAKVRLGDRTVPLIGITNRGRVSRRDADKLSNLAREALQGGPSATPP
jgi:hypothetical protein